MENLILRTSFDVFPIVVDFSPCLQSGETISSTTGTASTPTNLIGMASASGSLVTVSITGSSTSQYDMLLVKATTSLGAILEKRIPIRTQDIVEYSFNKLPADAFTIAMDFNELGESLSSAAVSAMDMGDGTDKTSTVIAGSSVDTAKNTVKAGVQAGTAGRDYRISFQATMASGNKYQQYCAMFVRN